MTDWRTLPLAPEDWLDHLLAMPREEAARVARAAIEAWIDGVVELELVPTPMIAD